MRTSLSLVALTTLVGGSPLAAQASLSSGLQGSDSGVSATPSYENVGVITVKDHNAMHFRQELRRLGEEVEDAKAANGGTLSPEQNAGFTARAREIAWKMRRNALSY